MTAADQPATAAPSSISVQCRNCGRLADVPLELHARALAGATLACAVCTARLPIAAAAPPPRSALHPFGWALFALGAVGLLIAFVLDTTTESGYGSYDRVQNLGLLVRQVVVAVAAGMSMVTGAVLVAAGHLADIRDSPRTVATTSGGA